jgi:ADP-ribosylglycohydrolase
MIGDALGGPFEFQPKETWSKLPHPPKIWKADEVLDAKAMTELRQRVRLQSYRHLRPLPETYAHWNTNAAPGTITDDTRHKIILLHALRRTATTNRWPLTAHDFAQAYCDWPPTALLAKHPHYAQLNSDWLAELRLAARWTLGERDPDRALPTERLWNSLPTCVGQMNLTPLAAIFPGEPSKAYLAAWEIAWGDNGFGRDMNCALVAGLAAALVQPENKTNLMAGWLAVETSLRKTDPLRFNEIPWCERQVNRFLDKAERLAREADHRPAKLFAAFDREFAETGPWEAQVPFVIMFACARLCDGDPLATLALTSEWGHDTDSYPQLAGAFIGALHGVDVFPKEVRGSVEVQLQADYGENLDEWVKTLKQAAELAHRSQR